MTVLADTAATRTTVRVNRENVDAARLRHGYVTYDGLARACGITRASLFRALCDGDMTMHTVAALSTVLGLSFNELLVVCGE